MASGLWDGNLNKKVCPTLEQAQPTPDIHSPCIQIFIPSKFLPSSPTAHKSGGRSRGAVQPRRVLQSPSFLLSPAHFCVALHFSREPLRFVLSPEHTYRTLHCAHFYRALHISTEPCKFLHSPASFYRALHISTELCIILQNHASFYSAMQVSREPCTFLQRRAGHYLRWISTTGAASSRPPWPERSGQPTCPLQCKPEQVALPTTAHMELVVRQIWPRRAHCEQGRTPYGGASLGANRWWPMWTSEWAQQQLVWVFWCLPGDHWQPACLSGRQEPGQTAS